MRVLGLLLCAVVACAVVACAVAASPAHAGIIFGATASGGPGQLYTIDPANGSVIQNIGALNDSLGTNYPITGLAFHPTTGILYGSTGNNPTDTAARFVTVDPLTAQVTVIGSFDAGPVNGSGTPATMTDLAFDAAGNLYGVGSIGGPQLYSINLATGKASVIGNTGLTSTTGGGLEIVGGIAYGTPTASRFGTYDLVTGAYTDIGNPAKPGGGGAYAALTGDENGMLYGLNSAPGSPPPTFLVTINPANAGVTNLGGSVLSLDAIAYIPEPTSATLLLVGVAAVTRRARRRR